LAAVYLASKAKSVNFIFGMINNVLYFTLFFRFHLYSMMLLQVIYFIFSAYGFYRWKHPKGNQADKKNEQQIRLLQWKSRIIYFIAIIVAGILWGYAVINLQSRFPEYFDPPAYPLLDAVLTMASVAGQWLLSNKYFDNWPLWIVTDIISCILYAVMGMFFTSLLYGMFTIIAFRALIDWGKIYKGYKVDL
jgi:nicotinamide mononucleotide transporter